MKRRTLLSVLPLALLATSCSNSAPPSVSDGAVNESLELRKNSNTRIESPYKASPTFESKASVHIKGISNYIGKGVMGTYFLSSDQKSIVGIDQFGQIVWQSSTINDYKSSGIVREKNRDWLLIHEGNTIKAYDLLSTGTNKSPTRETPAGENVSITLFGVTHKVDGKWEKWSPSNGTKTTINLPGGKGDVIASTSTGYLYKDGAEIKTASNSHSWGSGGEASLLGAGSSIAVLSKPDKTVLFINTLQGKVVATAQAQESFNKDSRLILSNTDNSFAFSNILGISLENGTVETETTNADVVGILDGIAYLKDGSGYDIFKRKILWTDTDSPSLIVSGRAFYLKNGELYIFDKK